MSTINPHTSYRPFRTSLHTTQPHFATIRTLELTVRPLRAPAPERCAVFHCLFLSSSSRPLSVTQTPGSLRYTWYLDLSLCLCVRAVRLQMQISRFRME